MKSFWSKMSYFWNGRVLKISKIVELRSFLCHFCYDILRNRYGGFTEFKSITWYNGHAHTNELKSKFRFEAVPK